MENDTTKIIPAIPETELVPETEKKAKKTFSFVGKERDKRGGGNRGGRGKRERARSDMAQNMISIRRVARVVSGGRRFSFSVTMVVGDRNGKVGVGMGKAGDTTLAIDKAIKHAKKHMISVPMTKSKSITRETSAKFSSCRVYIQPAPGRGLSAGGSVRTVLDLAGLTDVNAKVLSRSKNRFNNAKAAILALSKLR
ncbi:MAG: 30S ribosomal protein S5 [Patescibacteria group bacterium]